MRAVNKYATRTALTEWAGQGYVNRPDAVSLDPRLESFGANTRLAIDVTRFGSALTTFYAYATKAVQDADTGRDVNVGAVVYADTTVGNNKLSFWSGSVWTVDAGLAVDTAMRAAFAAFAAAAVIVDGVPVPGPPGTTDFADMTGDVGVVPFTPTGGTETTVQDTLDINKPTDVSRASYIRTPAAWADALGVMAGPGPDMQSIRDVVVEVVATGRRGFIPAGNYDITSQITTPVLTKPFRLDVDRNAVFTMNPAATAAFLAVYGGNTQSVEIEGGTYIDNRPYTSETVPTGGMIGIMRVRGGGLYKVTLKGGETILTAKGDNGLFTTGVDFAIWRNTIQGWGDSALYLSGESSGQDTHGFKVTENRFVGCPVGVVMKRLGPAMLVAHNTFQECGNGVAASTAQGTVGGSPGLLPGGNKLVVSDNQFDECVQPIYLDRADDSIVDDNRIHGWGWYPDGTAPASTRAAIRLIGTTGAQVKDNLLVYTKATDDPVVHGILMQQSVIAGMATKQATKSVVKDNTIDSSGRSLGRAIYEADSANNNRYSDNDVFGTWVDRYYVNGGGSMIEERDETGRKSTRFQNVERFAVGDTHTDVKPAATGFFRIFRYLSSVQYWFLNSDSTANRLRGMSAAASAKPNWYESNADGPVTGGELGHAFYISGVQKTKITSDASYIETALLPNFANDAAAAAGGVVVGREYRNGSVRMVRIA